MVMVEFDQNDECVGYHVDVIKLTTMKNMMTLKAEGMRVKAEAYKNYGDAALVSMVLEVLPHLAGEVINMMMMILMTMIMMIMTMMMILTMTESGGEPAEADPGDCSSRRRGSAGEEPTSQQHG